MMIYIAELSTPFLNVSWLLNELKNAPALLNVIGILLVLTFFVARVVLGPYLLYHMITFWNSGPPALYYVNVAIIIFFILMNYFWFYQLMKKVVSPSPSKSKSSKKKSG